MSAAGFLRDPAVPRRTQSAAGLFYDWRAGDLRGRSLRARVKVAAFIAIAVVVALGVGLWFGASGQQRFVVHSSSGSWRVETGRIKLSCPWRLCSVTAIEYHAAGPPKLQIMLC